MPPVSRIRCIKRRGGGWLAGEASKGWCSRISSSMGFHALMAITPTGFLTGFGFSPASMHDTRLAEAFLGLRAHPSARLSSPGQAFPTYVADRGFRARLAAKVGLHNFCCWLNLLLGRTPLAFADLLDF